MRDIIIAMIVFGLLPWVLMRPPIGILLWSWLGYMNPHRLSWSFAYDFPFAQIVTLTTFVGLIFWKERWRPPAMSTTWIWLMFLIWMTMTTFFALDTEVAWVGWDKTMKIQIIAVLTIMLMRTRERIHQLVWVIVVSFGFFGLKGGLYVVRTGAENRVWGPPGSFIQDNNALALALIMTLPLMWYLYNLVKNRYGRFAIAGVMATTCLAILGSHSRGAVLAAGMMLLALMIKQQHKVKIAMLLLAAIPVAISFMPEQWFDRMGTIATYEEDTSAMGRLSAWEFATDMAIQRPIGGGFNSFTEDNYRRYSPHIADMVDQRDGRFQGSHSIYFRVLGEHGFVGLGLFLLLGLSAYRCGSKVIRKCRRIESMQWAVSLAQLLQVSMIGFAVGGAFLNLAYFDFYYHLIALLIILRVLADEEYLRVSAEQEDGDTVGGAQQASV